MKKLFRIFLLTLLTSLCLSTFASAQTIYGECGDNLTYSLNTDTGHLSVSGRGKMWDWTVLSPSPWSDYKTTIRSVDIGYGVTTIGERAFELCRSLTEVSIPDTVTTIGGYAFQNADSLTTVKLGRVETVHDSAFNDCDALTTVDLGSRVSIIHHAAFIDCGSLTKVIVPDTLRYLWNNVFAYCNALETVCYAGDESQWSLISDLGSNEPFTDAPNLHFECGKCFDEDVFQPDVPDVPDTPDAPTLSGQCGENLTYTVNTKTGEMTVTGKGTMGQIEGREDFAASVRTLRIGEGVTSAYGFRGFTSLTSVELGKDVTLINEDAFNGCTALTEITVPDSVTEIGIGAFGYCTALTTVKLGTGLETIEDSAFTSCRAIETVIYGGSELDWRNVNIGRDNYYLTGAEDFRFEKSSKDLTGTFGDGIIWTMNPNTGTLTISGTGEVSSEIWASPAQNANCRLGDYMDRVETLIVSGKVSAIANDAFSGMRLNLPSLTTVKLGDSVKTIGQDAFVRSNALVSLDLGDGVETIGMGAFADCANLTEITVPDSVTEIGDSAFSGPSITTVKLGKGLKTIGNYAFAYCGMLTELTLPDRVTTIGQGAFTNTGLTEITVPDGVTVIDSYVFADCTALTEITIPDSVTEIGNNAFQCCDSLTTVFYAGSKTQWNAIVMGYANESLLEAPDLRFGSEEEEQPTVSGQLSVSVSGATVEIGGESVSVKEDGSFSLPAGEEEFDVVIRIPGALTHTVKAVKAEGDITLPEIVPVKGDTNGDDMINIMDMGAFRANFGKVGANISNAFTDVNGDGMVNIMDMGTFRSNFGKTAAKDCTFAYGA